MPQYYVYKILLISSISTRLFLLTTVLSSFNKVNLCYVLNCYISMLIYYISSLTIVLRQQQIASSLQYSCIYKSNNKTSLTNITNIYFRITRLRRYIIITNVSFLKDYSKVVILNSKYQVYYKREVKLLYLAIYSLLTV